jgi:hypothetical protein
VVSLALVAVTITMLLVGGLCALITWSILGRAGVSSNAAAGWGAVLGPIGIVIACFIVAQRNRRIAAGVEKAVTRARTSVRRLRGTQTSQSTLDPFA